MARLCVLLWWSQMFWKQWLCSSVEQTSCVQPETPCTAPPTSWPRRLGRACRWNFSTTTSSQVSPHPFISLVSSDVSLSGQKPVSVYFSNKKSHQNEEKCNYQKDGRCVRVHFILRKSLGNLLRFSNLTNGRLKELILHYHFHQNQIRFSCMNNKHNVSAYFCKFYAK